MMEFALLLKPMWLLLTTALMVAIIEATRPVPASSTISGHIFVVEEEPTTQFRENMEAQSPGTPEVRVVHHQDLNKRILVALILASTLLGGIVLFLSCCWIYRQKTEKHCIGKKRKAIEGAKGMQLNPIMVQFNSLRMGSRKSSPMVFDYQLLEAATDTFSESKVLSKGGSGILYRASLDEKFIGAVKKVNSSGEDSGREFKNEVNWLSKIQHQNIIKLLGCCIHGQASFLVYEMMQNGSLESQLCGSSLGSALTWKLRLKIAVEVARGLEYLHEHCNPPVVHRDLNSSSILLDSNFNAKLSDFGLAITFGVRDKDNIRLSGISDYVAPEYILDGMHKLPKRVNPETTVISAKIFVVSDEFIVKMSFSM